MILGRDAFHRLCLARDLLADSPESPLTIPQIARLAGISPFHFIRQFQALFGVTPHQFRIRARLDRARLLLARHGRSVTDVCMEVGFSSLGTFSHLFTRRIGTPPSEYRKRARILVPAPPALPHDLFPGCLSLMQYLPASAFRNFQEAPPTPPPLQFD